MQRLIQLGMDYVQNELVCEECGNPVEFGGTPEKMVLDHSYIDGGRDDHEPYINTEDLLVFAHEALNEGHLDAMHDYIRAYVVLESMTKDVVVAIDIYKKALRDISDI